MIRHVVDTDTSAVVEVALSSGLFTDSDVDVVRTLLGDFFAGQHDNGHACLVDFDGDQLVGVAYYQPAPATDGTWSLLMIAVHAQQQGAGRGSRLLQHVEQELRRSGQRLLLVETSGVPEFAKTRDFYVKAGYTAEARVRDYFAAGDDMVLYRKDLMT